VHFPSKEHLLAELVRTGHEAHQQALRAALLEAGADPTDQLRAIVGAHVRMHATYPHIAVVVNTEMDFLSPELLAPGLALRRQSAALLIDIIVRGKTTGHFTPLNVTLTAAAISAMGLRLPYWYSPASGIDVDELVDMHVELALRMVGAGRGSGERTS
jgi:AcrR family transcriptional regulator